MGTKAKARLANPWHGPVEIWQWTELGNGDDGAPVSWGHFADRSVQVTGTFGEGGTIIMEGSNMREEDTPTYFPLVDPQGGAISFEAAGGEQVLESTNLIRPRVTAGDGDTDLTVTMFCRK